MFLDDGVSRDSALHNGVKTEGYSSTKEGKGRWADVDLDPEAKNKYREIHLEHVSTHLESNITHQISPNESEYTQIWSPVTSNTKPRLFGGSSSTCKRTLTITTPHDEFNPTNIGDDLTIVFWHDPTTVVTKTMPEVQVAGCTAGMCKNDIELKASVVTIPITACTVKSKIVMTITY